MESKSQEPFNLPAAASRLPHDLLSGSPPVMFIPIPTQDDVKAMFVLLTGIASGLLLVPDRQASEHRCPRAPRRVA